MKKQTYGVRNTAGDEIYLRVATPQDAAEYVRPIFGFEKGAIQVVSEQGVVRFYTPDELPDTTPIAKHSQPYAGSGEELEAQFTRHVIEAERQRGYHMDTIVELGHAQSELLKLRSQLSDAQREVVRLEQIVSGSIRP